MTMFFEKIYCINLDRRPDRWAECLEEFERVNWKVERFPAIDGGDIGFNKTQLAVIKKASRHKNALILEDDVAFVDMPHLEQALSELPKDWDVVTLGATVRGAKKYSDHLFEYTLGWATHAVAYSAKMMKWITENFKPDCGIIYDAWLEKEVLGKFKCYVVSPIVAYQRPSFSDIRKRFVDYTDGFKEGEKLLR